MIPITTDTQRQLYQNVLKNFEDDTARLVLADAIEEEGGESATAYAEFIRLQCDLAKAPPPRKVLKERAVVEGNSPDYFLVSSTQPLVEGGMLIDKLNPGDRVDIPKADIYWRYGEITSTKKWPLLGLRFLKFMDGDGEVVLVRDQDSGRDKWKKDRHRERQLLKMWEGEWLKDTYFSILFPPLSQSISTGRAWKRGLLNRISTAELFTITDGTHLFGWTNDLLREMPSIRELVPHDKQPIRTSIGGPWHWFADVEYSSIVAGFPFHSVLPIPVFERLKGKTVFPTREEAIVVLGETLRNWVVEENERRHTETAGQTG